MTPGPPPREVPRPAWGSILTGLALGALWTALAAFLGAALSRRPYR